jgi:hypothetical protein
LLVELIQTHAVDVRIDGLTGVVDQAVHPPCHLFDLRHHAIHLIRSCQVALEQETVPYLGQEFSSLPGTRPVMDAHPEPLVGQGATTGRADTRGTSGNDGDRFFVHSLYLLMIPPTDFGDRLG